MPGDVLILAKGTYTDAPMVFVGQGTAALPITLRAATPGQVILVGDSRLQMSGQHLIVEGLWFREPAQTTGEVIELRTNIRSLASHCIVRGCAITQSQPVDLGKSTARFVSLYGTGNRIERCHLEGKTTGGTTLVVWLTPGGEGKHVLQGNYFGPREVLGENGGETIRIGDSKTHDQNAQCEVSGNHFYQCNGEGEIISVKSCANVLRGNTFIECEGALTLRHAHRCIVEGNVFLGHGKRMTGGVRIVGEDHLVRGNFFQDLQGDDYRSAITFMNAIEDTSDNGYQAVKRVVVEGNVVLDCKVSLLIGMMHDKKCKVPPTDCTFRNNVLRSPKRAIVELKTSAPGWTWENNVMAGKSIGIEALPGIVAKNATSETMPPLVARESVGVVWLK